MWSLPGHASRSELVGCLQTVEHCGKIVFSRRVQNCLHSRRGYRDAEYRKSTGRGCDRYPSVNGTLVTSTLVRMGPGQPRLDSGSPQQAGFPCQMLSQGFWAATHLPFAVRLQNPLSSIGSSRRLIEIMQSLSWSMNCVMSIQNTVFSGQTGHHEHRRQDVTDAINAHHGDGHHYYKHTVDATETVECRCLVILALMCLPIQSFLLPSSDNQCWFRLCFFIFHARRLQIMARMTEGSLPQSSAMFVNKLPWRLQKGLSYFVSVTFGPPCHQFPHIGAWLRSSWIWQPLFLYQTLSTW